MPQPATATTHLADEFPSAMSQPVQRHLTATMPPRSRALSLLPLEKGDRRRRWMRSFSLPQRHLAATQLPRRQDRGPHPSVPFANAPLTATFSNGRRLKTSAASATTPLAGEFPSAMSQPVQRHFAATKLPRSQNQGPQASLPSAFFRAKYSRSKIAMMTRFS